MAIFSNEKLSHLSLSEKVQEILREKIINQQIAPGTKLVEELIAQELGVSRTPVRQALNALSKTGLFKYIPRKGMYTIQLTKKDVDELYDIRMVMEGLAIYRATLRIGKEDLADMCKEQEFAEQEFQKGNLEAFINVDTRFHDRIIANCENQRLQDQLDRIRDLIFMYRLWCITRYPRVHLSLKEHRELLEGMIRRDQEYAEKCMRQHIELAKIWLLEKYPFERSEDY